MAEDEPSVGIELAAPTESRAELAMRARIAARLDLDIGQAAQRVGRYEVVRRLGAGGMGVVYEARDPELDRTIAVKILRPGRASVDVDGGDDGQERLRREARALAKLSHPHVVQIHEVGEHDGVTYVAMELVRGRTLHEWLRLDQPSRAEILAAYCQAGQGLAAAHEAGIVHRDFKPSNALIGDDGRVRVVDFGLARGSLQLDETTEPTHEGPSLTGVAGTPGYIAPELPRGEAASARSDQYSFCVALWEAVSGARPSASSRFGGPRWLRRVLLRGLAEAPEERWPDMPALLRALERRPRWRAWLGLGLPIVGVASGLWLSFVFDEASNPCGDLSREFVEVWNEDSSARLRGNLLTLGRTNAEVELVVRALDRQRVRWVDAETEACEATHVESSWPSHVADAASRCLAENLQQARALIELFDPATGDPPVSVRALLARLDDPQDCAEIDLLSRRPQSAANGEIAELRQSIGRARLLIAGETRRGDEESGRLLEQARRLWGEQPDDLPTQWALAEALELRAELEQWQERPDLALPLLREAVPLARRVGDVGLELRCLHRMGYITAEQLEEPERAADLVALAVGVLNEVQPSGRASFDHALTLASVARAEQRYGDAVSILREAVAAAGGEPEFDATALTRARLRLANVLAEDGKLQESLALYMEIVQAMREQVGEHSIELGFLEANIGNTLYELGRSEEAEPHLLAAKSILEGALGPKYLGLHATLTLLAELERDSGRHDDALRDAQWAWDLQKQLPTTHGDRGEALKIIAHVHAVSGRYEQALATYELIVEVLRFPDPFEAAALTQAIGWTKCRLGRCSEARQHFESVIAQSGDLMLLAYATTGIANADIVDGKPEAALERLERLGPVIDGALADDVMFQADAAWLMTRALIDVGGDRARARAHYERAMAAYAKIYTPPDVAADLEQIRKVLHVDE